MFIKAADFPFINRQKTLVPFLLAHYGIVIDLCGANSCLVKVLPNTLTFQKKGVDTCNGLRVELKWAIVNLGLSHPLESVEILGQGQSKFHLTEYLAGKLGFPDNETFLSFLWRCGPG